MGKLTVDTACLLIAAIGLISSTVMAIICANMVGIL